MSPWAPLVAPFAARVLPRAPRQRQRQGQRRGLLQPSTSLALATSALLLLLIVSSSFADRVHWRREDLQQQIDGLQVASSSNSGEKPRLIPLVASESGYSENSSVNILCTVSQGHHETLTFDWFKDGQLLDSGAAGDQLEVGGSTLAPRIEKHSDHSLLRISRVLSQHSGRYTCSAKSKFGKDSSSVNLDVNGNYNSYPVLVPLTHYQCSWWMIINQNNNICPSADI